MVESGEGGRSPSAAEIEVALGWHRGSGWGGQRGGLEGSVVSGGGAGGGCADPVLCGGNGDRGTQGIWRLWSKELPEQGLGPVPVVLNLSI